MPNHFKNFLRSLNYHPVLIWLSVTFKRTHTTLPFFKGKKVACISNADPNSNNVLLYWQFQQPKRISLSSKQKEEEKKKEQNDERGHEI
jgi:hypothetical protein